MALRVALCCLVLLLSLLFSFTASMRACKQELEDQQCQYIVRVKTGDVPDAGTDSTISLELNNPSGNGITVDNLTKWGIMSPGHKYFQRNNLDLFRGVGSCLNVCAITVASDDKGKERGWYLKYVEITITGFSSNPITEIFTVEQWLSLDNEPYSLKASVDICSRPPVSYI